MLSEVALRVFKYCMEYRLPYKDYLIKDLEKVQKRATKLVKGFRTSIITKFNMLILMCIRLYSIIIIAVVLLLINFKMCSMDSQKSCFASVGFICRHFIATLLLRHLCINDYVCISANVDRATVASWQMKFIGHFVPVESVN